MDSEINKMRQQKITTVMLIAIVANPASVRPLRRPFGHRCRRSQRTAIQISGVTTLN